MFASAPFLAPLLAAILSVGPEPVPTITLPVPRTAVASAVAAAVRIPGVGRIVGLYSGPVQPKLGYGSRPKKHIRIGVSVSF